MNDEAVRAIWEQVGKPEGQYPTGEQLLAFLRACPDDVGLGMANYLATAAQDSHDCLVFAHKRQIAYYKTVVAERVDVVGRIEDAWDEACAGNRNPNVCESCRAYADAIEAVQ